MLAVQLKQPSGGYAKQIARWLFTALALAAASGCEVSQELRNPAQGTTNDPVGIDVAGNQGVAAHQGISGTGDFSAGVGGTGSSSAGVGNATGGTGGTSGTGGSSAGFGGSTGGTGGNAAGAGGSLYPMDGGLGDGGPGGFAGGGGTAGSGGGVSCTLDPYAAVNWSTWEQYKANFHTHTTNSDGDSSPSGVIDEYHSAGYSILAITEHDAITWPWTDYGRDPSSLGMIAVRGVEYSATHHVNAFYDFTTSGGSLEVGIPHIQSSGGLCQINHPGRYALPSGWSWYIPWFRDYPACVGLEVFNQNDRYPADRALWDNVNQNMFESYDKLVWGFANDDKHGDEHLYRGFQFMLMPSLTEDNLKTSQTTGAFYFCHEPGGSGDALVPRISEISVDHAAKQITITATDHSSITWVGPGTTTVGTGTTFDYSGYLNRPFVRAVLQGSKGDCYTQPFGMKTN